MLKLLRLEMFSISSCFSPISVINFINIYINNTMELCYQTYSWHVLQNFKCYFVLLPRLSYIYGLIHCNGWGCYLVSYFNFRSSIIQYAGQKTLTGVFRGVFYYLSSVALEPLSSHTIWECFFIFWWKHNILWVK